MSTNYQHHQNKQGNHHQPNTHTHHHQVKSHHSAQDLDQHDINSNIRQNYQYVSHSTQSMNPKSMLLLSEPNNQQLWSTQKEKVVIPRNLITEMNECLQQLDNQDNDSYINEYEQLHKQNTSFKSMGIKAHNTHNINDHYNTIDASNMMIQSNKLNNSSQMRSNVSQNNHYSDQMINSKNNSHKLLSQKDQIQQQMNRSSSNNIRNGDIYSFEKLNQDDLSLSDFPKEMSKILGRGGPSGQVQADFNINKSINMSQMQQQSTPQLFREELRNLEATQSSPQINIQELSQQIKAALIAGSSPTSTKNKRHQQHQQQQFDNDQIQKYDTQDDASCRKQQVLKDLPSQFSTNYKSKNPYKSRQISIHTNAFLATDAGDNFSNNQEIFSTARTTSQINGSTQNINSHRRITSNAKSFFTQTNNNTFISYDNNTMEQAQINNNNMLPSPFLQPTNKQSNDQLIASDSQFNFFQQQQQMQYDPIALSQIQSQIFNTLNNKNNNSSEKGKISLISVENYCFNNTNNNSSSTTPHSSNNNIRNNFTVLAQEKIKEEQNFSSDQSYGEEFVERYQQALKNYQEEIAQQAHAQKKRLVTYDEEIKLRPTLKRKIKPLIAEPSDVPMSVYYKIISYDGRMFKKFVCLSKGMRKHLLFYVFDSTFQIAKDFNKKYGQLLMVESRMLSLTPLSFDREEGVRLELSLRIKVRKEASKIANKSVQISNGYSLEKAYDQTLTDSRINGEYQSVYQFDLYKEKKERWMWLHKDECLFHGATDARAYSMPIMPICINDSFEISITLLNLMGALDFNSVKWQSLRVEPLPNQDDIRDYNRYKMLTPNRDMFQKYFADLKRVCEVEDTIIEWFTEPNVREKSLKQHIKRRIDSQQFKEQFEILNVEVGGIDFSVWKVQLKALKEPSLHYKYYEELNIGITNIGKDGKSTLLFNCNKIKSSSCCDDSQENQLKQKNTLCNEVKRTGFLIDRGCDIEVRPGDTLIVYLSMGGFEK